MATRPTREKLVLRYLLDRSPNWVPGYELTTAEVGGSEGLRRLRQAREKYGSDIIQMRKMVNSDAYEYRIVP